MEGVVCTVDDVMPGYVVTSPALNPAATSLADTEEARLLTLAAFCTSTVIDDGWTLLGGAAAVALLDVAGAALPLIAEKKALISAGLVASASVPAPLSAPWVGIVSKVTRPLDRSAIWAAKVSRSKPESRMRARLAAPIRLDSLLGEVSTPADSILLVAPAMNAC